MIHIVVCWILSVSPATLAKDRPAMTWSVRRVSTLVQTFVRSAEQLTDTQLHSDIAPGGAFVRYEGSPQV